MIAKNYKISVIQPAIPDYRIFLFSGLYKKFKFLKVIYCLLTQVRLNKDIKAFVVKLVDTKDLKP